MTQIAEFSTDQGTLTISVPLAMRRHRGRKQVVSPAGAPDWAPREVQVDSTLVKALARAFRWRRLLENGVYASIQDIAEADKINSSYVSRVLRLTLLAPDIVEASLKGAAPAGLTLDSATRPFSMDWEKQNFAVQPAGS